MVAWMLFIGMLLLPIDGNGAPWSADGNYGNARPQMNQKPEENRRFSSFSNQRSSFNLKESHEARIFIDYAGNPTRSASSRGEGGTSSVAPIYADLKGPHFNIQIVPIITSVDVSSFGEQTTTGRSYKEFKRTWNYSPLLKDPEFVPFQFGSFDKGFRPTDFDLKYFDPYETSPFYRFEEEK